MTSASWQLYMFVWGLGYAGFLLDVFVLRKRYDAALLSTTVTGKGFDAFDLERLHRGIVAVFFLGVGLAWPLYYAATTYANLRKKAEREARTEPPPSEKTETKKDEPS